MPALGGNASCLRSTEPDGRDSLSLPRPHPRSLGWIGTTALAIGGCNQGLFLLSALLIGQGNIPGQGTAAIPLLT